MYGEDHYKIWLQFTTLPSALPVSTVSKMFVHMDLSFHTGAHILPSRRPQTNFLVPLDYLNNNTRCTSIYGLYI